MSAITKVSFAKALAILKKFRYKPRKEWNEDDRTLFKLCNFAVLSKKRLNKVLLSIQSLSKLSHKSHYKYSEIDIKLIKELILESMENCFKQFNQKINVIKESDIENIQSHIKKLKDENSRLESEINRLNFIVENFIREKEISNIEEVNQLLNQKISKINKKTNKIRNEKLTFDKENISQFIEKWNEGYTTFEIVDEFKRVSVNIKKEKKKSFKL